MATVVHVPYPLAGCFKAAETIIGADRVWEPGGDDRRAAFFAEQLPTLIRKLAGLADAMKTTASFDHEAVNAFFAENGFPEIKFDQPFGADEFGVGAILKVAMAWAKTGSTESIWVEETDTLYPAALLECGGDKYKAEGHQHPIARIASATGYDVFLTIAPRPYDESFAVEHAVIDLQKTMERDGAWGDILFPKVSIAYEHDLAWLINFNTQAEDGRTCRVVEAKQLTKFGMDHEGAVLESAAAMKMALECMRFYDVQINTPFLLWVVKQGEPYAQPIMSAYVDTDCWKDPKKA